MANWLYEELAVVGGIDPQAAGTGTSTTDVIDMRYWEKVLFIIQTGTVATAGTVDFYVNKSTATGAGTTTGTGTAAVANITQLTAGDDNVQVLVEVHAEDLGATSGTPYRYIRGVLARGGGNSANAVVALGHPGRYQPANDYDLASVDEITTS